ncbi:hypothetical protein M3Y97_01070900 [Aphelenchoides bicaudatus]|nr:hypothetical protein M3Y97_01070900 [Aphelenchoides bicaudatus]
MSARAPRLKTSKDMLRQLLELPENPRLMKPKKMLDPKDRSDIDSIDWEEMESDKTLSSYGYTKENALAHEPVPLAFLLPDDKKPTITPLSIPKPIPDAPAENSADAK